MKLLVFTLTFLFLVNEAIACDPPIATSTIYYTPSAQKVCGKWYYGKVRDKKEPWTFNATEKVCPEFEKAVKLEGSGHYNPNEVYTYDHEVIPLTGRPKKPDCPTSVGRSGRCLLTYISVAADTKYNPLGTYISMPSLKGKKLTLPDGSTFTHPGYLRVDDIGSAIKGSKNRFDFYSGNMDELASIKTFPFSGESCSGISSMEAVRGKKTCPLNF